MFQCVVFIVTPQTYLKRYEEDKQAPRAQQAFIF